MSSTLFARSSWAGVALVLMSAAAVAAEDLDFPTLPSPPAVEGLIGMPQTFAKGRSAYLAIVAKRAEEEGLPAAVADAVAQVETAYDPNSVGGVGEIGLMQIRPQTAAMLGYKGDKSGLFDPETNVQYAVAYLARAWRLANGDLCRTLMKYRAGHGEERMSPLSVEYCRRARTHLAAIGSPLADGALPPLAAATVPAMAGMAKTRPLARPVLASSGSGARAAAPATKVARSRPTAPTRLAKAATPQRSPKVDRVRVASTSQDMVRTQAMILVKARQEQRRKSWAEHETRLSAIQAKLKKSRLNIASGI